MAERRPEVRSIEPPGLLSKLWGKTLDAFGVSNDFQEDSTSWRDAVRNSANYISPYNVGHGGNLEPQTPRAATDFIDANKGMMERMGRAEPEPLDGLMAFGLSSGVGGLGRRVEQRAVGAAEPKPAMAFANADEKAALAAGAGAQPIRAYRGFTDGNLAPGPRDGEISPKFWASSSPDVASSYALDPAHEYRRWSPTGAVAPLDIDFKNPLTVDARGRPWNSIPWEDGPTTTFKLSKHAQGLGYDGLVIKNVQDSLRSEAPLSDTYAALQPNTVRSATTGETLFSNGDEKAGALGAFGESSQPTMYRGVRMADKPGPISPDNPYYWMTSDPNLASDYALGEKVRLHYQSPAVIPAVTDFKNPMTVDAQGQHWMNVPQADGGTRSTDGLASDALKQGHDGLIVNNVNDAPYDGMPAHISTVSAALQPGTVKSPLTGETLFSNPDEKMGAFSAAASNLPMDQASRLARAKEMGFDTERTWYHGSTHDINAFDPSRGNAEGHLGAGSYFTTSPKDAGVNYGPSGVDLTNRIERLAERLSGDTDMDMDAARAQARLQIAGSSDGAIYPTFLRGKTLDLRNSTRGNPTALEVQYRHNESDFMDAARGELGPDADKWDLYDRARELADEASVDFEPKGELWNFAQSIRSQADQYGFDADEVIASLDDYMAEGVGPADGIDRALRGSPLMYAEHPETGALIGNDVIRQAFSDAGYPNIMMDAKSAFPRMPNIDDGTLHMVVSDPKNIRSVNAAFDPSKSDSAYLLAANADEKAAAFAAAAGEPKGITAYHGSPHDFDKFSLDKIGTGEGAQAYGHGLYFADNEGVAKSYRDALKGKVLNIDGLPKGRAEAADELASRIQQAIPTAKQPYNAAQMLSGWLADGLQPDQMKARIASGAWPDDMKAELYAVTDKIAESASPNPGKMYQVRINADPESFLDWDKPLSQQTKAGEIWNNYLGQKPEYADPAKVGSQFANPTGKELYSAIFEDVPGMGVPARSAVTEKLKEQGLSGIRYLDGQSRADGAGSSNYVVFDDSLIEILKKYGMAGGALGAGALLQSGDAGATPFGASSQTLIPPLMEQSLGAFGQPDDDQD